MRAIFTSGAYYGPSTRGMERARAAHGYPREAWVRSGAIRDLDSMVANSPATTDPSLAAVPGPRRRSITRSIALAAVAALLAASWTACRAGGGPQGNQAAHPEA